MNQKAISLVLFGWIFGWQFSLAATDKTASILLDLRRESECNHIENYLASEALEVARQRAEVASWAMKRLKAKSKENNSTILGKILL